MPTGVYTRRRRPVTERFWPFVQMSEDCWTWTGSTTQGQRHGYGQLTIGDAPRKAHVVAWGLAGGRLPAHGEVICHTCDNTLCVRNDSLRTYEVRGILYEQRGHLWLGTVAANSADMADKGRMRQQIDPSKVARGSRNGAFTHPETVRRGEQHHKAKLTEADVKSIRVRYRSPGVTTADLAAEFGVSCKTIRNAASRRFWRHID